MAKLVKDPLDAPEINTFGDDIEPLPPLAPAPNLMVPVEQHLSPRRKAAKKLPHSPKPPKVKLKNLKKYIYTELALLDDSWGSMLYEYNLLANGNNMDVDEQEENLEKAMDFVEGQVQALFQMGRHFGLSVKDMNSLFPNLLEDGKFSYMEALERE